MYPKKQSITLYRLVELLRYNPESGYFIWKVGRGNTPAGSIAGSTNKAGYSRIKIDNKLYLVHRLAWLYYYGYMPENHIDHIDRNPSNNRISNLREASQSCNMRNTHNRKDNKSGVKGVSIKRPGKWQVQISIMSKVIHCGYYNDFSDAVCHRLAVEQCLGWGLCDSRSPAFEWVRDNIQPNLK